MNSNPRARRRAENPFDEMIDRDGTEKIVAECEALLEEYERRVGELTVLCRMLLQAYRRSYDAGLEAGNAFHPQSFP